MRATGGENLRGASLGLQVADVGHEQALPQQMLAAGQVLMPAGGLFPPRLRAFVVQAPGAHRHAGPGVEPGLHGVAMEDEAVDPFAKGPVAQRLDVGRMALPFFGVGGGEGLGADDPLAVDVAGGGHFRDRVVRPAVGPRPELAHRLVALAAVGHVVERPVAVGLDRELQSVLVGQLAEMAGVVLRQQVGNRLPQVPEEPLGDFHAIDDPAGEDGQVAEKVVAAALAELLAHLRRPVLRVDFPTVDVRGDERLAGQRRGCRR